MRPIARLICVLTIAKKRCRNGRLCLETLQKARYCPAFIQTTRSSDAPSYFQTAKLTKEEVAVLEQWIREGATYQKHWAFESLDWQRLAPYIGSRSNSSDPANQSDATTAPSAENSPIDSFVKKELANRQINLQPPADRETLARRAAFDITGLPPAKICCRSISMRRTKKPHTLPI